jgi:3-hydroxybutyryl-CoA dehydrogenase
MKTIDKIGVVGAGMMGSEIALNFAISGKQVLLADTTAEIALKGKEKLKNVLDKAIKKGKFPSENKDKVLANIVATGNFEEFHDRDIVVEAVFESLDVKTNVLKKMDDICKEGCILTSNTSSISITKLASYLKDKRRATFLGTHFFSPASVMKLVEVIPGLETEEETVLAALQVCREIGKTPIRVKDVTGFVVNRILHIMWIEANRLLEEGVATPEDIDLACKLGLGHPVGPYGLMDITNNDLNLQVQEILFDTYGERFRPRPILKQMVNGNHLGRKTGRGWYNYPKQG